MWEAFKSLEPSWFLCIILLAFVLVEFFAIYRLVTAKSRGGREAAYQRGLEYALTRLYRARLAGEAEEMDVIDELEWQADRGRQFDPSPFDEAITDVLRNHTRLAEVQGNVLTRVKERLESMHHLGEASTAEVGLALDVLDELHGGTAEEPAVFSPTYYRLTRGIVQRVERPLYEYPSWIRGVAP